MDKLIFLKSRGKMFGGLLRTVNVEASSSKNKKIR
jgi:hypothetical protein